MKKINAVGIDCPKPVIMTKKEFDEMDSGVVKVLADNKPCVLNLEKFADSNGFDFEYDQVEEDRWEVTITKGEGDGEEVKEEAKDEGKEGEGKSCSCSKSKGSFVVAVGTREYGTPLTTGDIEFSENLMQSFIYTVSETEPYPDKIIFFNSGVFLTTEGSPVLDDLKKLEENGVEIYSCGACLNYYDRTDLLQVGEVSNMYDIYESIRGAERNMIIS